MPGAAGGFGEAGPAERRADDTSCFRNAAFGAPGSDPVARAVATFIFAGLSTQLATIQEPAGSVDGYYFWDPLAAIALADTTNTIVQTTAQQITVSLPLDEENDTSGSLLTGSGPTIDVATTVDAVTAKTTFLSTITGISQEDATALLEKHTGVMAARSKPGRYGSRPARRSA